MKFINILYFISIFFAWALIVRILSETGRRQEAEINRFNRMLSAVKYGVCDRKMGIRDIVTTDKDGLFTNTDERHLSRYAEDHIQTLKLSGGTLEKLKTFEDEAVFASSAECASLICEACDLATDELQKSLKNLKSRIAGYSTVVTAFSLIIFVILL